VAQQAVVQQAVVQQAVVQQAVAQAVRLLVLPAVRPLVPLVLPAVRPLALPVRRLVLPVRPLVLPVLRLVQPVAPLVLPAVLPLARLVQPVAQVSGAVPQVAQQRAPLAMVQQATGREKARQAERLTLPAVKPRSTTSTRQLQDSVQPGADPAANLRLAHRLPSPLRQVPMDASSAGSRRQSMGLSAGPRGQQAKVVQVPLRRPSSRWAIHRQLFFRTRQLKKASTARLPRRAQRRRPALKKEAAVRPRSAPAHQVQAVAPTLKPRMLIEPKGRPARASLALPHRCRTTSCYARYSLRQLCMRRRNQAPKQR